MFKKTLIATAAAAFLATGSLALTTSTASATYYGGGYGGYGSSVYIGGNGWQFGWSHTPHYVKPPVRKVCKNVYKKVKRWTPYYGWVWTVAYAGRKCWYEPIYYPY